MNQAEHADRHSTGNNNVHRGIRMYLRPFKKHVLTAERAYRRRFPGSLRFPDFMGIGSGQAGSTWLFRNLSRHPRVFIPALKETHYFDRSFDHWWLSSYCALFEGDAGQPMTAGELTPSYNILRPDRIRVIRDLMPDVRLFLIIRNPVDRAWSGARNTLSKVAAQRGCALEDLDDKEFYEYFSKEWAYRPERNLPGAYPPGMLQGHYCRAIDNWTRYFPEEQLLICFFDEISSDPRGLMERILKHIGADTDIDWSTMPLNEVVNSNPAHAIPDRFRAFLDDLYKDEIRELRRRFSGAPAGWLNARA